MTGGAANAFYLWQGLPQTVDIGAVLAERGLTLDTSGATNLQNFMAYGTSIVGYLPCIDLSSAGGYTTTMFRSAAIDGIERLVVTKYNNFTDMFTGCTKLKRVIFSGVIASGTLNLSTSPLLDADSLESVINCLSDETQDLSVVLPSTAQNTYDAAKGAGAWQALLATKQTWHIT